MQHEEDKLKKLAGQREMYQGCFPWSLEAVFKNKKGK